MGKDTDTDIETFFVSFKYVAYMIFLKSFQLPYCP